MKKMSLTSKAVRNAFGANKRSVFLLMIAVIGSVLFSLIPPQILRMIIDNNLAKGISGGLKGLAVLYLASAALCGLCDFSASDCHVPSYLLHHRFTLDKLTPYFRLA